MGGHWPTCCQRGNDAAALRVQMSHQGRAAKGQGRRLPTAGRPAGQATHQIIPDDVCLLEEQPHLVGVVIQPIELGALQACLGRVGFGNDVGV